MGSAVGMMVSTQVMSAVVPVTVKAWGHVSIVFAASVVVITALAMVRAVASRCVMRRWCDAGDRRWCQVRRGRYLSRCQ